MRLRRGGQGLKPATAAAENFPRRRSRGVRFQCVRRVRVSQARPARGMTRFDGSAERFAGLAMTSASNRGPGRLLQFLAIRRGKSGFARMSRNSTRQPLTLCKAGLNSPSTAAATTSRPRKISSLSLGAPQPRRSPAAILSSITSATSARASKCGMWPILAKRCTPTAPASPRAWPAGMIRSSRPKTTRTGPR